MQKLLTRTLISMSPLPSPIRLIVGPDGALYRAPFAALWNFIVCGIAIAALRFLAHLRLGARSSLVE